MHLKILRPKLCLLMLASLVALDGFHLLSVHSADYQFDSRVKWWIHVSSTVIYLCKKLLFVVLKQFQTTYWIVNVLLFLIANTAPTLNTDFLLANVHAKWRIYCLLISLTPLLSHTTSTYNQPKQVCGVFWCFPGQLPNLGDLSVQHHCVCTTAFKVNIPPLTIVSDGAEFE